ncbi:hypothetical protein SAMN04488096_10850 [Mesonia phycicola]|uniref:Uncharacterized protein n=1 Tax=Mesonia phycicola TaxID=579105 RepID=A0A1M6GHZ8_9FLAO|nr:hypothetical protein [Mesonia phycicola]SHJ09587.1 hypothetical protein SAMN04488096_10850 [Mesonia phycicola]
MKIIRRILIFSLLTILTQVGGVIYFLSILLIPQKSFKKSLQQFILFLGLYMLATLVIVPYLAPVFGREKIRETNSLQARSIFFVLANRNYVVPELNESLREISAKFNNENPGIKMLYLDASFPFFNHFPLLPHLSHHDGKKIDVSLIYENNDGTLNNKKPSVSGYGVFEEPTLTEYSQIDICKERGYWQYDYPKYLTFGSINRDIKFSKKGTRQLVNLILKQNNVEKLFIEPHLKTRLQLNHTKIRFHGCQAVRHDDHIHFQLK